MGRRLKIPHLDTAQRFVAGPKDTLPIGNFGIPHPEVDAVNHALTIGSPGLDLEALSGRIVRLLAAAYASSAQPRLGRNWHQPLVKLTLPISLDLARPNQLGVGPCIIADVPKDEFYYGGPKVFYELYHFEAHRRTIEAMWQGPVLIQAVQGWAGSVKISPARR